MTLLVDSIVVPFFITVLFDGVIVVVLLTPFFALSLAIKEVNLPLVEPFELVSTNV